MSLKQKMGAALLSTAMGAALIGGGTFAIFTDSATNAENTFTSGNVDINVTDSSAFSGERGTGGQVRCPESRVVTLRSRNEIAWMVNGPAEILSTWHSKAPYFVQNISLF